MLARLFLLSVLLLAPLTFDALAIDESQTMERMDKLEHDIMLLQRQIARGEPSAPGAAGDAAPANPAQMEVRLSAIEDQLRELRGKTEENENRVKKLSDALEKMQKDNELRFADLAAAKAPAATPAPPEKSGSISGGGTSESKKTEDSKKASADDKSTTTFASPREHYNYAFRLLNQTQYEESASAFDSFTKKYPKDPLVGNAYYWEGETYYIRRDYVAAADNFRKGFEALPEGPKAGDNLLKLAMSLSALNRDKEACLVLKQVVTKFKKTASSVADKADQEQKRISCDKS